MSFCRGTMVPRIISPALKAPKQVLVASMWSVEKWQQTCLFTRYHLADGQGQT